MDKILDFFKRPFLIALPALAILIVSLVLFAVKPLSTRSLLYIFPDNRYSFLNIEQRNVPQNGDKAENIASFLKELPAGSRDIEMAGFINKKTTVNRVLFDNGILIIDFSKEMNDFENSIPLTREEVRDLLIRNIRLNYNGIDKIVITVDGRETGSPFYSVEQVE